MAARRPLFPSPLSRLVVYSLAMALSGSQFLDAAAMPWRPFDEAPGVAFKVLKTHLPGTGVTLLLRFAAGATYPTHRHPEGEEYYVLDGELVDDGRAYGAG